jgi:hypothetical protein
MQEQDPQQPPDPLADWGEPISPEDEAVMKALTDGTYRSPNGGRPLNRGITTDADAEQAAYVQRTREEVGRELSVFAAQDGREGLSVDELMDYLTSTASGGAHDGLSSRFYNIAVDAQMGRGTDIRAIFEYELAQLELHSQTFPEAGLVDAAIDALQTQQLPFSPSPPGKAR